MSKSRVIYKYELRLMGVSEVTIPVDEDYRIRDVDIQGRNDLYAWIEHTYDPNAPKQLLSFMAIGTGEIFEPPEDARFLKTVHFRSDQMVFHIYQLP